MNRKSALMATIPTLFALVWFVIGISNTVFTPSPINGGKTITADVHISPPAMHHILYGDEHGGGHLHGAGVPCKSEFPANWTGDDIMSAVQTIAANDNQKWRVEGNGYHVSETIVRGVQIRTVLNRNGDSVITAYPLNTRRNPCPPDKIRPPANDNTP